ncbi:FAD/NAD(P)-binding domain-containing protein [Martensiomyces pterosporus]|nr:FAD/NAD(P)-binding domain-containing protein [Martensiomyces pterosporus]
MSEREINIVVVGGSWAGVKAVRQLLEIHHFDYPNMRITLVEQRSHYFHKSGIIRGMVDQRYAERLFIPYNRVFSDGGIINPNHKFVCGRVEQVHNTFIDLEGGRRVFFDYLILATGAQYQSLPIVQANSIEESRMLFTSMRESIEKASRILFVGGGAVGVGMCGEIAENYPRKKLMLAHARNHLLNGDLGDGVSTDTEKRLKKMGVQLILGEIVLPSISPSNEQYSDRRPGPQVFTTKTGHTIECDLAIWTTGARPETGYMSTLAPSIWERPLVDPMTGRIQVTSTLQLDDRLYPHIFAVGDVNSLSIAEKYAPNAVAQAKTAVENIHILMEDGHDYRAKVPTSGGDFAHRQSYLMPYMGVRSQVVVPLGRKHEVSTSWGKKLVSWAKSSKKGREYMLDKAAKMLNY